MQDNYNSDSDEEFSFPGKGRENPFAVPKDYFGTLAERIVARIELEEELQEFPLLSAISKPVLFETPENYFSALENSLEYQQELAAFEELQKANLSVQKELKEEEYFEGLDQKIAERLSVADELKEHELLYAIDKKNNFALDPDYFETIADRVKEKKYAENYSKPSVFATFIAYIRRPKIAFAYSIALVMVAGLIWYNYQSQQIVPSGDCKTLACLEKKELLNEHTLNALDEENLYDIVDVEELDKQLSADSTGTGSLQNEELDSIKKNNNSSK